MEAEKKAKLAEISLDLAKTQLEIQEAASGRD